MIVGRANTNCDTGTETSGVSAISYTLSSCEKREKFVCSLRIS